MFMTAMVCCRGLLSSEPDPAVPASVVHTDNTTAAATHFLDMMAHPFVDLPTILDTDLPFNAIEIFDRLVALVALLLFATFGTALIEDADNTCRDVYFRS